jgi:aspartate/methionine/tyrosine aminotransferase/prephenate dehydratase/prephenate dehydrogenase
MISVSYQGERGSYSEEAINTYLGSNIKCISHKTFEDVFKSVSNYESKYALIPIENSLGGSIHKNYDLLQKYTNLHIIGEYNHKIVHNLIVYPGTRFEDIETVISHWQAIAQCEDYLENKNLISEIKYDTAGSCKFILENEHKNMAAIASSRAATEYNLEILDTGIEDNKNNYTRFLLIGCQPCVIQGNINYKTSIVFSLKNVPGALHKGLSAFALRDIDLTKVESRPNRSNSTDKKYSYFFYVDFVSHPNKIEFSNSLRHLREIASFVRILGTYPKESEKSILDLSKNIINNKLTIGILGFGRFGQFLGKELVKKFKVIATSRTNYKIIANNNNIKFYDTLDKFFTNKMDYLIVSTSILSFEKIILKISKYDLSNTLVIDVCSVKTFPKEIMIKNLKCSDLLCTHPMFGPDSGKTSWVGLPFVYENVRIKNKQRAKEFINFFSQKGCSMLELSCEKHDEYAASSQFITHLTGRILSKLNLKTTPINTNGFNMLLGLINNTEKDSLELFQGLYKYNKNSEIQLKKFKNSLFEIYNNLNRNISNQSFSQNVLQIEESKTSKMHEKVLQKILKGESVISLAIGQPGFTPHEKISMGGIKAIAENKVKYTKVSGIFELRNKISNYLKQKRNVVYKADEIICTSGAKHAIFESLQCICNPNDEVIIPAPYWVSYPSMAILLSCTPKIVETKKENNFCLTAEELENAITNKTKVLILCNPNNPTGVAYCRNNLEKIVNILQKYPKIYVITDEIYEGLMHTEEFVSISQYTDLRNRLILVGGFSKIYAMCGYRLGYIASCKNIIKYINRIQGQTIGCSSSISQYAALKCFNKSVDNWIEIQRNDLNKKKKYIIDRFDKEEIEYIKPNAAFYIFVYIRKYYRYNKINSSTTFCEYLLDKYNIACTPGSAFGNDDYLRICYSIDDNQLEKVVSSFIKCIKNLT